MPVMELTVAGSYFGQQTINRFNYVGSGTPAAVSMSFALAQAFGAILAGPIVNTPLEVWGSAVDVNFVFEEVSVRDVYSVTDFYATPFNPPFTGSIDTDNAHSPAVAVGLRTNRIRTDVRRGQKRIAGINENSTTDGGVLFGTALTAFNDLATQLSATLTYDDEGNTLTFVPAVCGKEKVELTNGNFSYRYYETETEQLAKTAQGVVWSVIPEVRTQVTRQYGRGR